MRFLWLKYYPSSLFRFYYYYYFALQSFLLHMLNLILQLLNNAQLWGRQLMEDAKIIWGVITVSQTFLRPENKVPEPWLLLISPQIEQREHWAKKAKWKLPSFSQCLFFWNNFTTEILQRSKEVNQEDLRVNFFSSSYWRRKLNIHPVLPWDYGVGNKSGKNCDMGKGTMGRGGICVLFLPLCRVWSSGIVAVHQVHNLSEEWDEV